MSCMNNLEKLRTEFNVFVMNPSGRGGGKRAREDNGRKNSFKKQVDRAIFVGNWFR